MNSPKEVTTAELELYLSTLLAQHRDIVNKITKTVDEIAALEKRKERR